jgi:SAM-dependent methyltransferase
MTPAEYDAWYDTPRGRWIGETEFQLLEDLLEPAPGETLLDVGCGTGWFSRQFAGTGLLVTGVDVDEDSLAWARCRPGLAVRYLPGDARQLPFPDKSFDCVASVTALCFIKEWPLAVAEIARVSRRRFVLGLLNRNSLLWRGKGRGGSRGTYAGAHWHTRDEIACVLNVLSIRNVRFASGVFIPSGTQLARMVERITPTMLPLGAFLAVAGDVAR